MSVNRTRVLPVHIPTAFKVGDQVAITTKVEEANSWGETWNSTGMDKYIGQTGLVVRAEPVQGFQVRTSDNQQFWFPSPALALLSARLAPVPLLTRKMPDQYVSNAKLAAGLVLETKNKKKKRVRVGKGPWDQAPCSHLRWHLMGFFREKLALVKTTVKNSAGEECTISAVDVTCTKCETKMTLQAK